MSDLYTKIQLSQIEVTYKELSVKDYKVILKCLLGNTIDIKHLFLNLNKILTGITDLTEKQLLELNCLDYLLLLTNIRTTSIGASIFAVYKNENNTINIDILLDNTMNEIRECQNSFTPFVCCTTVRDLNFRIPLIKDIVSNRQLPFIEQSIEDLPVKYLKPIKKNIEKFRKIIDKYFFFNSPVKKYSIKLSTDIKDYIQLIKILFNEDLLTVYDNIFYLSKICNMSADYLESITYGEFKVFVKKTEEMLQKKTTNTPAAVMPPDEPFYEPVDVNTLYGNEPEQQLSPSDFTP